ncbi:DUF6777 domain-containing protein [Streptomyces sp. NPDC051315]|uniref:DUF6777 domain-containing protein n=1 Tax=Streptomyces sp. NPDC051315 TaxID=3365650 RepID=UPI00379E1DF9
MSVEPPSSGRPTGPPSGPLSGRSQPPAGPPSQPPAGPPSPPSGGSSGGTPPGGTPEPRRQWWKSVPRLALLTTALVVAVALALVLTRTGGGGGGGDAGAGKSEVFLQAAGKTGPDPFTDNTANTPSVPPTTSVTPTTSVPANVVQGVDGGAGGVYGGTRNVPACDVEKQVRFLRQVPAKNAAFASVAGVAPSQVPAYLRSLTPVQLRYDTRVTNHGYRDGAATPYQAVLQSGTAVLVDARGVPRVRCACGNPLTPPVAQRTTPEPVGDSWPSYRPSNVVVVTPSTTVVEAFVLYDLRHERWFARERGDTGEKDRPAKPPAKPPTPSASVSLSSSPSEEKSPRSPSSSPSTSTSPGSPPPSGESPSSSEKPPTSREESPSPSPEPPSEPPPPPPPPTTRTETEQPASPPEAPRTEDTTTQSAPASQPPSAPSSPPAL